jgi:hypothetical protein
METWKPIKWFNNYEVSNIGNIKSIRINKLIKTRPIWRWYLQCMLCSNWKKSYFYVHRLVALAFLDNIDNKKQINHINWIKDDNRLENLERVTCSENLKHSYSVLWRKKLTPPQPYYWKWKKSARRRKVVQKDFDWNIIKIRDSIKDATDWLNLSHWFVWSVCRKEKWHKTAWGYYWEFF